MSRGLLAAAAVIGLSGAAFAAPIAINNDDPLADATSGLVPLDLSGVPALAGSLTSINSLEATFDDLFIDGTIKAEVFGNVSSPGATLNRVRLVYTITSTGTSGLDESDFGVNSTLNLDKEDYVGANSLARGVNTGITSVAQTFPNFVYNDNSLAALNDTFFMGFGGTDGVGDPLGDIASETFSFYFEATGAVTIGVVPVVLNNAGSQTVDTLAFVVAPGQPDLGVPAPGAAALLGLGLGFAGSRRRR